MESILKYIIEKLAPTPEESKKMAGEGTTDNALYYRIGRFKFDWKSKTAKQYMAKAVNKYNIRGEHKRSGLISWQKDTTYPLCPDELECIHRKDWELDILDGVSEDALYHKHYDIWWDYIYKHHKPRHKVLTVFECSNMKPYCYAGSLKQYAHRWADFSDFASMDYGIQQWEFTNMYPSRWDEWDHYKEDPRIQFLYAEKTKERILEYHKNFPQYEKIIFICQNNHPQRPVNELWEDNTNNFRSWAVILIDDDFRKKIESKYSHMSKNILIQRIVNLSCTRKKYIEELCKCYSSQKDKDEIKRRGKMSSQELIKEGIYNIYGPKVAAAAYAEGKNPFDPDFMKEYAEKFKEENVPDKNKENDDD